MQNGQNIMWTARMYSCTVQIEGMQYTMDGKVEKSPVWLKQHEQLAPNLTGKGWLAKSQRFDNYTTVWHSLAHTTEMQKYSCKWCTYIVGTRTFKHLDWLWQLITGRTGDYINWWIATASTTIADHPRPPAHFHQRLLLGSLHIRSNSKIGRNPLATIHPT